MAVHKGAWWSSVLEGTITYSPRRLSTKAYNGDLPGGPALRGATCCPRCRSRCRAEPRACPPAEPAPEAAAGDRPECRTQRGSAHTPGVERKAYSWLAGPVNTATAVNCPQCHSPRGKRHRSIFYTAYFTLCCFQFVFVCTIFSSEGESGELVVWEMQWYSNW